LKILDFGIAKLTNPNARFVDPKRPPPKTKTGSVLGSPQYFAPEQALADLKSIGPRTDLYAVGGVLYRMLSGFTPFQRPEGNDLMNLMRAHVEQSPELPSAKGGVEIPIELERIVMKALSKAQADRYQTAREFAEALWALRAALAITSTAPL